MKLKYCLMCERDVMLDVLDCHSVAETDGDEFGCETFIYTCYGPFTTSQPPENFDPDWDLQVVEPSQEELAIMNCHAEELMQDFEM